MIGAYMVDPIIIIKWNGYDEWNQPEPTTPIPVKGYIEWKTRLVRNISGEQVVSQVSVMLMKKIDKELGRMLCHEDRIQFNGEDFERAIISIQQPKAFGNPHYEVNLA